MADPVVARSASASLIPNAANSSITLAVPRSLQIVSGVGEVEGFVAEGKVRDDVLQHGVFERGPVPEGRIDDLDAVERRGTIGPHPMPDGSAPRFDEAEGAGARGERREQET